MHLGISYMAIMITIILCAMSIKMEIIIFVVLLLFPALCESYMILNAACHINVQF